MSILSEPSRPTAVYTLIGIVIKPKVIEPFQIDLGAIGPPVGFGRGRNPQAKTFGGNSGRLRAAVQPRTPPITRRRLV